MAGRAFNGLSGAELRHVLVEKASRAMGDDPRFAGEDPVTAQFAWSMELDQAPAAPRLITSALAGKLSAGSGPALRAAIATAIQNHLAGDTRFGAHLAFPFGTPDWHLKVTLTETPLQDRSRLIEQATGPDPLQERREARARGSEAGVVLREEQAKGRAVVGVEGLRQQVERAPKTMESGFVYGADGQKYRLVPVAAENGTGSPQASTVLSRQPGPRKRTAERFTPTGLEITVEALPSPGAAAAGSWGGGSPVGTVQTVEFGSNPETLDPNQLGAADRVRREFQLPVPTLQKTKSGQFVDVPAGTF